MSTLSNVEPYIAVPESVSKDDFEHVAGYFIAIPRLQVVKCNRVPVIQLAGPEPATVSEVTHWIVNFGPDLFRQMAFWALVTYAGKKVIDGFASEAGKDLWNGVKWLCNFILRKFGQSQLDKKSSGLKFIALRAEDRLGGLPGFSVGIEIPIPNTNALLAQYINDIETGWPWMFWRRFGGQIFGVNPHARTYEQWSGGPNDSLTAECLHALGMTATRRKNTTGGDA